MTQVSLMCLTAQSVNICLSLPNSEQTENDFVIVCNWARVHIQVFVFQLIGVLENFRLKIDTIIVSEILKFNLMMLDQLSFDDMTSHIKWTRFSHPTSTTIDSSSESCLDELCKT